MPTARQLNLRHGLRTGAKSVVEGNGTLVDVGALGSLTTTVKSTIVEAVNEVKENFSNITTSDVPEPVQSPTRLYFTNDRAREAISVTDSGGDGSLTYNNITGVLTYTGPSASEVRSHFSGGTGVTITNGTISIGQPVATNSNVTFANTTLTGVLYGPAQFVIDPAAVGDATGEVIIYGNLTVQGTTTTINSTTVEITDKTLQLAKSADGPLQANGSGINVAGADANILYTSLTDSWNLNRTIKGVDGHDASPTYSFATDPGLGLYRSGNNQASISTNGLERLRISDTLVTLVNSTNLALNRGTYTGTVNTTTLTDNQTYTLPNVSGTIVITGDTGTVTSAMIADGTIVNADISATAEIVVSKLANGTARQLLQTAADGTTVEWASNVDVPGTLDVTGIATFDTKVSIGAAEPTAVREIGWNNDKGAYDVLLAEGVAHSLGSDQTTLCRNNSNISAIPKGTAVMYVGTVGSSGRIKVAPMVANGTYPGYVFLGVTENTIPAGGDGYVKSFGKIKGINTNAYVEQTILWCDPVNPGGFTATEPSAPNLKLAVAAVVSSGNSGILMVRWDIGRRLKDLHDVEANGTTENGDILTYNSSLSRWENRSNIGITGNISLASSITFEGATANDFETVLSVVDPTSDRAISIPNESGNLIVSGNASIVNADISASAAIAGTKISPNFGSQNITTSGTSAAASFSPTSSGVPTNGMYLPAANSVAISTNGTGRLFVDASGNVGVGISSFTTYGVTQHVTALSGSAASRLSFYNGSTLTGDIVSANFAAIGLQFNVPNAQPIQFFTNNQERLRITSAGFVGIGTTSPTVLFHLSSASTGTTANSNVIATIRSQAAGRDANIQIGDGTDFAYLGALSGNLYFSTANTERARIDSSGRLLVGTSSAIQSDAQGLIQAAGSRADLVLGSNLTSGVVSGNNIALLRFYGNSGSTYQECARISTIADGTHALGDKPSALVFSTTADAASTPTERMRIDSSGRVGIGTTNPGSYLEVAHAGAATANLRSVTFANGIGDQNFKLAAWTGVSTNTNGDVIGSIGLSYSTIKNSFINFHRGNSTTGGFMSFSVSNDSEAARIDSSGRLLVGTSTSSSIDTLVLQGSSSFASGEPKLRLRRNLASPINNNPLGEIYFEAQGNQGALISSSADGTWASGTSHPGRLVFSTTADGASSPTERMRIDSSGRLLVGTSSSLSVNGITAGVQMHSTTANDGASLSIARFNNDNFGSRLFLSKSRNSTIAAGTIVQNDDDLGAIVFSGDNGTDLNAAAARIQAFVDGTPGANDMPGRIVLSTTASGASSPTERMRIDSAGSVTIFGQNNQLVLNRSGHSNWNFSNNSAGLALSQDLQDGAGAKLRLLISQESAPAFGIRFFNTSEVETLRVEEDGDVLNTNNSYGALSDIKLKENIVDANSQWDDVKALQVRNFNFKPETGYGTHTQIGLVAQEVELVSPGLVSESPDRDEDGNDLGTVTKSVNYSVLYMKAVKALQEAMERIETLEAKVAALESA